MDDLTVCSSDSDPVYHIGSDDVRHAASHTCVDSISEHTPSTDENKIHIVVVGGDIGALSSALAIADVEHVKVTMVNVDLGFEGLGASKHLRLDNKNRGLQLCTRTVSLLESLGVPMIYKREGEDVVTHIIKKVSSGTIVKRFSLHRCKSFITHLRFGRVFQFLCRRRWWSSLEASFQSYPRPPGRERSTVYNNRRKWILCFDRSTVA